MANITSRTENSLDFRTHQMQLEVLNEPFSEVVQMFNVTLSQNNFTIYLLFFKYTIFSIQSQVHLTLKTERWKTHLGL